MPFEDYNGNGVQDSAPGIGVSRGSFRTYGGGSVLNLRFSSAYYFVSDSGLTYYMNGYGAAGQPLSSSSILKVCSLSRLNSIS